MSEVSSSGTVDEKELISVPRELYHHFESLKNQTNLTTVDLMRKLLGEYQTSPRESFLDEAETMLSQRGSPCPGSGMSQAGDERPLISPDVTTASRTLTPKPVGRKKTERPGSKLNKVCEILHCKRAARELEEQKRQEVSDRNCNSVESSSSGTICSLEETSLSHSDNGASGHENFREPTRRATNAQAPAAHTSPAKDAVNLRKLLGSRTMKLSFDRKQQDDLADVVLDLSVRQNRSAENVGAQSPYEEKLCHQGSLIVETALFRRQEYSSPSPSYAPAVTANGDGIGSPMYSHQFPVNNDSSGSYMMLPTVVESSQPDMAVGYPPADNLPPRQTTVTGSDYITKAPRIRPRRPAQRKAPVNEGMKLINENTLYPGVYTSTFKLPGSRRGRRAAAKQNMSQVKSTGGANSTFPASSVPTHSQSNVMIQMTNGTQPSMMLCPQVAVSSVLVKSPRKRGRPPKRPSISQFQTRVDACPNVTAPLIPRTTPMTIPGTGMISSENGAVSYLYNSQPQQPTVTIQATSMQQTNQISSNEPAQLHPNHNQLMNILNHATSINACNPVFVPHSSLQNGVATAIPTNASGMITLPLQQMNSGQPSVAQIIPTAQANVIPPSPVVNSELHSVSPQHASLVEMTSADRSPVREKIEELSPMPMGGQPETGPTAGVFQEMILSPQSLINVKPRSKPTTTELIRSNSNFYCGSFKIRPQKPSTQTGQGTPVKRGRGRPRLNVFESNRQKETKESRSKMYQELFHCKVCNEIVSAVDRFCHQRKHVTVKLRCSTCGVEFQTFKGPDSLPVEFSSSHCPQCRKIFGYELGKSEESEDIEDLTDNKDAMEEEAETEKDLNTPNDIRARKLTCQLCGEICRSATEMAEHMLQHQDSPPTCMEDGCFQQFKNGSELRRHIRHIHGKGRGHTCAYDGCDKKFLKNCHLQEHIRVKHFNIKAFKCPWPDCSKEFAGIRHLKVHMLIHKDEKPLKCEYCDYRCRQRNALNWHMRKHPGVPFSSNEDPEGSDSDPDQQSAIDMSVFASQSDETDLKDYNPENSEADTCPPSDCDSSQANDSDVTEPGQMDV